VIEFQLDETSGVATYLQLVQQVRQALRMGMLEPGDQLPTAQQVVARLAINPNTVHKAYSAPRGRRTLDRLRPNEGLDESAQLNICTDLQFRLKRFGIDVWPASIDVENPGFNMLRRPDGLAFQTNAFTRACRHPSVGNRIDDLAIELVGHTLREEFRYWNYLILRQQAKRTPPPARRIRRLGHENDEQGRTSREPLSIRDRALTVKGHIRKPRQHNSIAEVISGWNLKQRTRFELDRHGTPRQPLRHCNQHQHVAPFATAIQLAAGRQP